MTTLPNSDDNPPHLPTFIAGIRYLALRRATH